MPLRDGTGPEGRGPLTGGGRGYCVVAFPQGHRTAPAGYIGRRMRPIGLGRRLLGLRRLVRGVAGSGYGRRRW